MADVVPVIPKALEFRKQVDEDVIQALEDWLRMAKAGEFAGVGLSAVRRDGQLITSISYSDNWGGLVGAVSVLKHRMLEDRPPQDGQGG